MIVICNGGMKSGSTWISEIIAASKLFGKPDKFYLNEKWKNPSIADDRIVTLVKSEDVKNTNIYSKQHWRREGLYDDLIYNKDFKFLNIVRDPRDMIVSRYFHDLRLNNTREKDVESFIKNGNGRSLLNAYISYQLSWHGNDNLKQPHLTYYERLKTNPVEEIAEIFEFLGFKLEYSKILEIVEKTSFENKKTTGEGSFFRKGVVGDWINHISDDTNKEIYHICENKGFFDIFDFYRNSWSID